jgi:hypothetical protein
MEETSKWNVKNAKTNKGMWCGIMINGGRRGDTLCFRKEKYYRYIILGRQNKTELSIGQSFDPVEQEDGSDCKKGIRETKVFFYNVFRLPTITPPTPVRASQAR